MHVDDIPTTTCDVECRLQAAARAFNANRWILCDPKVSIAQKLEYFDRVISPKRSDLRSMDVAYRRFLRSVVGPPRNMDGALPWHKIFHIWNEGVRAFTSQTGSKSRSEICRASLDQEGFSLATTGAHTQWPPKMLLGYFDYKFVPLEQLTFIGNFAIDVEFWRSNLPEFFELCKR